MTRLAATPMLLALVGGAALAFVAATRKQPARTSRRRPSCRVVVVGAGFGGLAAASRLAGRPGIDLTVIDAQNHHLFQPLLYQVATAALSPADIASPVRGILPATPSVHVLMARVTGIDVAGRLVLSDAANVPYDELIIATGSRSSYFGHPDWAEAAPSLKTLEDALDLRKRILQAFEQASVSHADENDRLLTFVLIGGGPTGVEMAGSIAELSQDMLARDFALPRQHARIVLIEAGPRILSAFTPDLSDYAARMLQELGVEIMTGTRVTGIEPGRVRLGDRSIDTANVIWTAGTEATPVAEWLGVKPGHGGRVEVGPDLSLPGHEEVAIIGDAALATDAGGHALPGLAPVAKQQGDFAAEKILRRQRGRRQKPRFTYHDYGTLATIGRSKAVAEFGSVHIKGLLAWITWAVAHIFFLIGFRNRVMVSAQWLFAYATHQRSGRLIIRRDTRP